MEPGRLARPQVGEKDRVPAAVFEPRLVRQLVGPVECSLGVLLRAALVGRWVRAAPAAAIRAAVVRVVRRMSVGVAMVVSAAEQRARLVRV